MRTGELDLYETARNARCPDHWAFEPHMERLPRASAGTPRQACHRHTQHPPIETQPSVQPGDPVEKVAGREDRLRAFAKTGGLRHARRDSPNMGWRNASFRGFADYMQTPDFNAGLRRLIKLANQKKTALMCAEAVPWRCHRSLIANALIVRGIRVKHVISVKRAQIHQLTSFGRIQGKCI